MEVQVWEGTARVQSIMLTLPLAPFLESWMDRWQSSLTPEFLSRL